MKNCKLTKYKKVVDNDNLLKYGEVRIPVMNGTINNIGKVTDSPSQVVTGLNGVLLNGASNITLSVNWAENIVVSGAPEGGVGYISFPDKYNIKGLNGDTVILVKGDLYKMFGLMPECIQFRPNGQSEYSLTSFVKTFPKAEVVRLYYLLTGAVSDLYPLKNTITSFEMVHASYKITGMFDDFGHFYKVNTYTSIYQLKFTGTVEGFVANRLIEQPATAGSVSVKWLGNLGRITYQGQAIENKENNTIAWDAQGNITLS